jgi:pyruvate/2-oxoglutarate/acetoin dehydrogenase E1 component
VTGADVPTPYAQNLETLALPTTANIVEVIQKVTGNERK